MSGISIHLIVSVFRVNWVNVLSIISTGVLRWGCEPGRTKGQEMENAGNTKTTDLASFSC